MTSFNQVLVSFTSIPVPGTPGEEIKSTMKYILGGSDYIVRVKRANKLRFTYLPPYNGRQRPGPMNVLNRFLNGEWRKFSWEDYDLKAQKMAVKMLTESISKKESIGRRLIWALLYQK